MKCKISRKIVTLNNDSFNKKLINKEEAQEKCSQVRWKITS